MKYTENDLEDWVCENIEHVVPWEGETQVVGRQIEIPGGRLDVLAATYREAWIKQTIFTVIEIKVDRIDAAAVSQALRYLGGLDQTVPDLDGQYGPDRNIAGRAIVAAPAITSDASLAVNASEDVHFVRLQPTIVVEASYWERIKPGGVSEVERSRLSHLLAETEREYWQTEKARRERRMYLAREIVESAGAHRPDLQPVGHRSFYPLREVPQEGSNSWSPPPTRWRESELTRMHRLEPEINALIRYDGELSNGRPYLLPPARSAE